MNLSLTLVALTLAALLAAAAAQGNGGTQGNNKQGKCTFVGQSVTAVGADESAAETAVAALSLTVKDECAAGYECNPAVKCNKVEIECEAKGAGWECEKTCIIGPDPACKLIGIGNGDPHLVGFDGSRFDFHGAAERHFVLFGRTGGDLLVAKMRAYEKQFAMVGGEKVAGTLFQSFGLQVPGTDDRVHVAMVPSKKNEMAFELRTSVNDCEVNAEVNNGPLSIKYMNFKRVDVRTADATYSFRLMRFREPEEAHLNVEIALDRVPASSDLYLGVLGTTLNNRLGHNVDPSLTSAARDIDREHAFVAKFKTDGHFPVYDKTSVDLTGVVRFATRPQKLVLREKLMARSVEE